jgi:hypothetical protein
MFFALALLACSAEAGADVLFDSTFPAGSFGGFTPYLPPDSAEAFGYPRWVDLTAATGGRHGPSVAFQPGQSVPNTGDEGVEFARTFTTPPPPAGATILEVKGTFDVVLQASAGLPANHNRLGVAGVVLDGRNVGGYFIVGTVAAAVEFYNDSFRPGILNDVPLNFDVQLPASGGDHVIELRMFTNRLVADGGAMTFYLDHATASYRYTVAVPEPGPLALAGVAIAAAAVVRSLRKARSH